MSERYRIESTVVAFAILLFSLAALTAVSSCSSDYSSTGECSVDSDADSDGDVDSDTELDTETESDSGQMESCAAGEGRLDPETGLCWQDPADAFSTSNWYEATGTADEQYNPEGEVDLCGDLELGGHDDWRLPEIDELISLLRGCVDGESTGGPSPSSCGVDDPGCLEWTCANCQQCAYCMPREGPCEGGCYWDPSLGDHCDGFFFSSSMEQEQSKNISWWVLDFSRAGVGIYDGFVMPGSVQLEVICVRD